MPLLSEEEVRSIIREELAACVELDKLVRLVGDDVAVWLARLFGQNVATWVERAEATAATATATRAGEVGRSHFIVAVTAGYGAAQIGTLDVSDGPNVVISVHIHNAEVIPFSRPLKITEGNAVSVALSAGAAGVVGKVNIIGFTV